MKKAHFIKAFACLVTIGIIGFSCRSSNPDIERGNNYRFESGYPEIRVSTVGLINEEDEAVINLATEIVYNSLVFKNVDGKPQADIIIEIKVIESNTGYSESITELVNIKRETDSNKILDETYNFKKEIPVQPGDYEISVTVTDNNTLKDITQFAETYIPDPENPRINLTGILMQGKDLSIPETGYFPITTYDVPGRMDSIRFEFQVTNNDSQKPLTIKSKLIKFESDTSIADPMSFNNPNSSSIKYKGIDMQDTEEIYSNTRQLTQSGSVFIEYRYPILKKGNYRFEVMTSGNEGGEIFKARDFSVKSDHYPAVKTVREFAEPLRYLMSNKEFEELMAIEDSKALKQAVDRFWLSHIKNPAVAKSVIELYYDRVERANKLFSSFKAGWKTDTGMIYILFGHPWYIEDLSTRKMLWSYSYDRNDFRSNFFFYRPKTRSKFYPFDHFLIQRDPDYFNVEYYQVELWLTGQILERNL